MIRGSNIYKNLQEHEKVDDLFYFLQTSRLSTTKDKVPFGVTLRNLQLSITMKS